jgi:hypothetical protein
MTEADPQKLIETLTKQHTAVWFESRHCKIYGKDRKAGLITPRCNALQMRVQKVIDAFEEAGLPIRIIGLKPRQKGSTTFFSAVDYTFLRRDSVSGILIGGQYAQVEECWDMLNTYQKNDTMDWGNTGEINTKEGRWSNGSKIRPETAKDALAGIGGTHQVLHCFEVARWSRAGAAASGAVLNNIMKCVPNLPGTVIVLESTAEGSSGAFFEKFIDAPDAERFIRGEITLLPGSFVRVFAAWFEFEDSAMTLTQEQKDEIKNSLDQDPEFEGEQELIDAYGVVGNDGVMRLGTAVAEHDVWEQLAWRRWSIHNECDKDKNIFDRDYPHSWKVAFQKSGNLRFNQTGIEVMRKRSKLVTPRHGIMEEAGEQYAFRQTAENEATHTIFEPPTRGCRYILAVDPMTGVSQTAGEDPDLHAAFVLRAGFWNTKGQWIKAATVARVVPCRWDIDVLEESIWRLARYYGGAYGCKIAIEMNMDRGLTELLKLRSADLYMRELFNRVQEKVTKAYGYQTNVKTREILIDRLASEIREWNTPGRGIDVLCPHALEQLEQFIRKENGLCSAAEGYHDDDVLALGLGTELMDHATLYVPTVLDRWGQPPPLGGVLKKQGQPGAFS